jgi:hypothetical protein
VPRIFQPRSLTFDRISSWAVQGETLSTLRTSARVPSGLAVRPWSNHQRCQLMSSRKHQTFSQQHNIWLVLTLFHIVIYYHILCVNILSYIVIYYQYVPPCWWENTLKDVCIFAGSAGSATKTAFQCLEGSCDKKDPLDPIKKRWVVHPKMLIIS